MLKNVKRLWSLTVAYGSVSMKHQGPDKLL